MEPEPDQKFGSGSSQKGRLRQPWFSEFGSGWIRNTFSLDPDLAKMKEQVNTGRRDRPNFSLMRHLR